MQLYDALYADGFGNVTVRTSGSGGGGGGSSVSIADSLVIDAAGIYWYAILTQNPAGGTPILSYMNLATGSLGTPSAPVKPAATNKTAQTVQTQYDAIAAGTGYNIGDALISVIIVDSATATVIASCWINSASQLVISAPSPSNIVKADQDVKVSGTVAISSLPSLPIGSNSIGSVSVSNFPATQPVSGSVSVLSLPSLPAGSNALGSVSVSNFPSSQAVSGTVGVSNFPSSQTVSGSVSVSNFPSTQAVSGTVGISSLPSLPSGLNSIGSVSVSNFPSSQTVAGTVAVSNLPSTQTVAGAVSVSNFPTTQPVSGSVSVSNFPPTQPVSGTVAISSLPSLPAGTNSIGYISVSNLPTTQSVSGTIAVSNFPTTQPVSGTVDINSLPSLPTGNNTIGDVTVSSLPSLSPGSSTIGDVTVSVLPPLPAGSNAIGTVSVSNFPSSQTVAGTVDINSLPSIPAGTNVIGFVSVNNTVKTSSDGLTGIATPASANLVGFDNSGTISGVSAASPLPVGGTVSVSNFPAIQPVSGTVSVSNFPGSTSFIFSTNNSSTVQLAAGATFTGIPDAIINQQTIAIGLTTDQPGILTIHQFIDPAGVFVEDTWTYNIAANVPLNIALQVAGNYIHAEYINNGAVATTTFNLNIYYGAMPSVTQLGNNPSAINEVGGQLFDLGNAPTTQSLPVVQSDSSVFFNGTVSITGPSAWFDTTNFQSVSIQVTSVEGMSMYMEGSNDGVTPNQLLVLPLDDVTKIDTMTRAGIYTVKVSAKYIRYNISYILPGTSVNMALVARAAIGPSAADMLSLAMDATQNMPLYVNLNAGLKTDITKGIIISDAPTPIMMDLGLNTVYVIDTTGYQSLNITTQALAGTVTSSDDGISWQALTGTPRILGTLVSAITANAGFSFPCIARYIRITATTAGAATAYLRAQPWNGTYTTSVPTSTASNNIAQVGATAVVTGGVAGTLAVGGGTAQGGAPSMNPLLIGGVDQTNFVRRLQTDTVGRLRVAAIPALTSPAQQNTIDIPAILNTFLNQGAINVQETGQFEGQSMVELLSQILVELKIANNYLYDLPRILQSGQSQATDEPDAFRNDPTIFKM